MLFSNSIFYCFWCTCSFRRINYTFSNKTKALSFSSNYSIFISIQQLAEGFVWFYVNQQDFSTARTFSVIFLFFALFFWITWIPIVAYTVETRTLFKRFFLVLSVIGFVFGLYLWLPTLLNSGPRHLISPYMSLSNVLQIHARYIS